MADAISKLDIEPERNDKIEDSHQPTQYTTISTKVKKNCKRI